MYWRGRALRAIILAAVAVASGLTASHAQSRQFEHQMDLCETGSADQKISGCTAVIQSGKFDANGTAMAYFSRGNAYKSRGDLDNAIADYTHAIRISRKPFQGAIINRANSYEEKGDLDHAIADYSQALQIWPDFARAWWLRGLVYYANGDYDRAIADYDIAIKKTQNQSDKAYGLYIRGLMKLKASNATGRADIAEAEALKPDVAGSLPKWVTKYMARPQ